MSAYDSDAVPPAGPLRPLLKRARASAPRAPLVIDAIAQLRPYPPSRPWAEIAKELGIAEDLLCLLAANENMLGPSPAAIDAAARALRHAHLYPDGGATALKAALAERLEVEPEQLVIGNGSNDVIELLIRTFVGPGETIVTGWPSFVVYRLIAQAEGRDALVAPLYESRYDLPALASLVDERTKLVFIANPNNPTGTHVGRRALDDFFARVPPSTIVVLDEAYREYVDADDFPNSLEILRYRPRTVMLRTFSKAYGLAGLRVGYGVMDAELAGYVERVRQPYNVSSIAQAAALAALADDAHLEASRQLAAAGKKRLLAGLARLGLHPLPSQANFLVVPVEAGREADAIAKLRQAGILVRGMASYGMPDNLRITVGTDAMNDRVLAALEAL